jgi:RNA polymerase subunit RPABC4/transcription elongation factor Spt4
MPDILDQVLADPAVSANGGAIGVAVAALWIAAAWWAYTDAARRTDSPLAALVVVGWIVVSTPLLLPFSLAIYSLARPQQTAAEHRARHLAAELVDEIEQIDGAGCRACWALVDPAWLRCPTCSTWLAAPCAGCGSWSDRTLAVCPWCGSEERADPVVETLETPAASRVLRGRRIRRALRGVGPGSPQVHRDPFRRPAAASDVRPLAPLRSR